MAQLTIHITKRNIYHIAEGISVTIAQHNGDTPTYEQLWASPDESIKLDIYYREAVSDMERKLADWLRTSTAQYNLLADADNYQLLLDTSRYWPKRLEGLLDNKIQDYLVHAVTAGWLNDFEGLNVKQDYQAMAAQDLADIRDIICYRAFAFVEVQRTQDTSTKDSSSDHTPAARTQDTAAKDGSHASATTHRRKDNVTKTANEDIPPYCKPKHLRHRDNDIVEKHSDWSDWSGTGIAFRKRMPQHHPHHHGDFPEEMIPDLDPVGIGMQMHSHRVRHGHGYTPSPIDERHPHPVDCQHPLPAHDPRRPDNPTHPNYPPITADGKSWSDMPLYDEAGSDQFINHECANEDCDGRNVDLSWDINDKKIEL